jgi:Tol biopolymer transport system component
MIAFDRYDVELGAEGTSLGTFLRDPDGTERPVAVPASTATFAPIWSPDGKTLLIGVWSDEGPMGPAVMRLDGTDLRFLLREKIDGFDCSGWSPDGALLACSMNGEDLTAYGIYTVHPDGQSLERITVSPFHYEQGSAGECGGGESRAVFSPDGERIAFVQQRCGTGANPSSAETAAIWVVGVDGRNAHEIVPHGLAKSHPGSQISWSNVRDEIVFGSQDGDLFTVRPDGTELEKIALPDHVRDHHAYGPEWSPDGTRIVFSLYLDELRSTDLYTIAPDGSDLVRITTVDGAEVLPRWGRPPAG